jgi:3-oxo-5-alpha-steroid 4-dehydrogenase 1
MQMVAVVSTRTADYGLESIAFTNSHFAPQLISSFWFLACLSLLSLICMWVYSNLCITAVRSHKWYKQEFPNYPTNRKAVIPFLL